MLLRLKAKLIRAPFLKFTYLFARLDGSYPSDILLHVDYQFFLLTSSLLGDISHVYPLARSAVPILVATTLTLLGMVLLRF